MWVDTDENMYDDTHETKKTYDPYDNTYDNAC